MKVLSESTEAYDRGGKFAHYRKLASLTADARQSAYRQPDNRWLSVEADSLHQILHLPSIDCHLALAEVYDKVDIVVE